MGFFAARDPQRIAEDRDTLGRRLWSRVDGEVVGASLKVDLDRAKKVK